MITHQSARHIVERSDTLPPGFRVQRSPTQMTTAEPDPPPVSADAVVAADEIRYIIPYRTSGAAVPKLKPSRDIQPVTEFRANAAQVIEQVRATGAPVILTQHGRSAAVLLDVEAYEAMIEELELLRDVRTAEAEIAAGKGRSHAAVAKALRGRLLT